MKSYAKPKQDPTKCDAEKASGGRCKQPAGWGTDHPGFGRCKRHGGCAPNGKIAAAKEKAEVIRAGRVVIGDGYENLDLDPGEVLLEELKRTYVVVRWYETLITEGDPELGIPPLEIGRNSAGYIGSSLVDIEVMAGGGTRFKKNIYYGIYQEERTHLLRTAQACLAVGLKEREVELAERQGELMFRVMVAVFGDDALGMTPEQRAKAPAVVRKHLAALPSGA